MVDGDPPVLGHGRVRDDLGSPVHRDAEEEAVGHRPIVFERGHLVAGSSAMTFDWGHHSMSRFLPPRENPAEASGEMGMGDPWG